MINLFALPCSFIFKKWEEIDWWLCINLHWTVRLWWHGLWIRHNKEHPSLIEDYPALLCVIFLRKKILRFWINFTRLRPLPTKEDSLVEERRVKKLEERLYREYQDKLLKRQNAVPCKVTTPSQQ